MNHDQETVKETKKIWTAPDGGKGPLQESLITNISESELDFVRKDWFKHVLLNIEKLYRIAEEGRKESIISLQMLRDDIKDLTGKISNKGYDEEKDKVNMDPAIKTVVCGALAGFISGIIAVLILYFIRGKLY